MVLRECPLLAFLIRLDCLSSWNWFPSKEISPLQKVQQEHSVAQEEPQRLLSGLYYKVSTWRPVAKASEHSFIYLKAGLEPPSQFAGIRGRQWLRIQGCGIIRTQPLTPKISPGAILSFVSSSTPL